MRAVRLLTACLFLGVAALGCEPADRPSDAEASAADGAAEAGLVEITAKDFEFEAPRRIPSGWTTFRFTNDGEEEHFFYVYRLPEGMTFQRFQQEAMVPFGEVWEAYATGELERSEAEEAFAAELPEWFFTELVPSGGVALTEPGETAQATVHLEPGTYAVECYVKTPAGTYHTERGMQRELVVTEEDNGAPEPEADVELTLSNYEIASPDELTAGSHTVSVHVEENPEGFMAHDVNLVRLGEDTDVEDVVAWMDWMDLDQFRAPAPGRSLGGLDHMAAGRTGYITVELEPGRYAWVSEGYAARGMVSEFTVE